MALASFSCPSPIPERQEANTHRRKGRKDNSIQLGPKEKGAGPCFGSGPAPVASQDPASQGTGIPSPAFPCPTPGSCSYIFTTFSKNWGGKSKARGFSADGESWCDPSGLPWGGSRAYFNRHRVTQPKKATGRRTKTQVDAHKAFHISASTLSAPLLLRSRDVERSIYSSSLSQDQ